MGRAARRTEKSTPTSAKKARPKPTRRSAQVKASPHHHDVVVIGGSAGAVEVIKAIAASLPGDLDAAVFVVIHRSSGVSVLPAILARVSDLPVLEATDKLAIEPGNMYVAVPDFHLFVDSARMRVVRGPRQNGHRPAVDALFASAAAAYGARVIGVVLSGSLDCGTHGLLAIKGRGGITVVQDPDDAQERGMPGSALSHVQIDHCVAGAELAALITRLVKTTAPISHIPAPATAPSPGRLAGFVCPECSGPLWEVSERGFVSFRCRVGHGYTAESLFTGKEQALEAALWAALNALSEKAELGRRLATRARKGGHFLSASQFAQRASDAEDQAAIVREVLVSARPGAGPEAEGEPLESLARPIAHSTNK